VAELRLFRMWLDKSKSKHTARQYSWCVKKFLEWLEKPLDEVGPLDITMYIDEVERKGAASARNAAYALRLFFRLIGREDVWRLIPTPVVYTHREASWLPEERIVEVVYSCRDPLDRALVAVGYEAALRRGEVVLLDREGYSPKEKTLLVRRLKRRKTPTHVLPLREWCVGHLDSYLGERVDDDPALFAVYSRGRWRSGWGRISEATVNYRWRRIAREAGIDPREYPYHTLRHSRGTNMAIQMIREFGVADVLRLAKFMGHANPSSTLVYVHLAPKYLTPK